MMPQHFYHIIPFPHLSDCLSRIYTYTNGMFLIFLTFRRRLLVRGSGPSHIYRSVAHSSLMLQAPSDNIVPPQLWSSSMALPLHLHFCNCSDVFSFTYSFDVSKPFQPSPSHNRRYCFHLCFFQGLLVSPVF